MLDAIEAVKGKGKRDGNLWDPRCRQYYEEMKGGTAKKPEEKAVNK